MPLFFVPYFQLYFSHSKVILFHIWILRNCLLLIICLQMKSRKFIRIRMALSGWLAVTGFINMMAMRQRYINQIFTPPVYWLITTYFVWWMIINTTCGLALRKAWIFLIKKQGRSEKFWLLKFLIMSYLVCWLLGIILYGWERIPGCANILPKKIHL